MNLLIALSFTACFAISGCGSGGPPPSALLPRNGTLEWKKDPWSVSLHRAGAIDFQPTSSYRIARVDAGQKLELDAGSAFNDDRKYASDQTVADLTHIHSSPDGNALLIQETIPNDCDPCDNYLLVRKENGKLTRTWLQLPGDPTADPHALPSANAEVIAIGSEAVWYTFGKSKPRKAPFTNLGRKDRPTPPG